MAVNLRQAHEHYKQQINEIVELQNITEGQYGGLVRAYNRAEAAGESDKLPGLAADAAASANARVELQIAFAEACVNLDASRSRFGQQRRAEAARQQQVPWIQAKKDDLARWEARSKELGPPASASTS
jgi:hypothetical protein